MKKTTGNFVNSIICTQTGDYCHASYGSAGDMTVDIEPEEKSIKSSKCYKFPTNNNYSSTIIDQQISNNIIS